MNTRNLPIPDNTLCLQKHHELSTLGRITSNTCGSMTPSSNISNAALFNELALQSSHQGHYQEAERYLEVALLQVAATTKQQQQQQDSVVVKAPVCKKARRQLQPVPDRTCTGTAATTASTEASSATSAPGPAPATPSDPRTLYIYQRELYDEGMRVYSKLLSLSSRTTANGTAATTTITTTCTSMTSATLWYNLGQVQVQLSKISEARRSFQEALDACHTSTTTTTSSSSHCHFLNYLVLHNLGYCGYRLGDNETALKHMEAALELVNKDSSSNNNNSSSSIAMDDTAAATSTTAAEEKNESVFTSTDLAASCNCVAVLFFHTFGSRQEFLDKALDLFQVALEHYQSANTAANCGGGGSRYDAQVATVRSNMGRIYFLLPDYPKALAHFEASLAIRTRVLGAKSLDVMTCLFNIAGTYHKQQRLELAQDHYQRFVALAQVQFLGRPHRDYAAALLALADIGNETGQTEQAAQWLEQAVTIARAALGPRHPDMVLFLSRHGNLAFCRKHYDAAIQSYQECLATQQCFLPSSHPSILVTLLNIARISKQCGRYQDAFLRYADIYAIQVHVLGPNDPETASTVFNMGLMKYICDDHHAALSYYQEALRLRRDLSESPHATKDHRLDTAAVLNSIGLSLFKLNHLRLAKEAFVECLRIRREIHGPVHREIATMLYNLATIHMDMGEDDQALVLYQESLKIEKQALGAHHPDISLTLQHLAGMHQERGELEEALSYFEQALDIERFHAAEKEPSASSTSGGEQPSSQSAVCKLLNLIGNIHLMMGRVDDMMECYQESCRLNTATSSDNTNNNNHTGAAHAGPQSLVIAGLNFYGLSKLHPPAAPIA